MAKLQLSKVRFAAPFDFDNRVRSQTSFYGSDGYEISLDTDLGLVRIQKGAHFVFSTFYNIVSFEPVAREEAEESPGKKAK